VFSFHAVKVITTGEGGMVTTNSTRLYEKLLRLRTHGISRDRRLLPPGRQRPWFYEKLELGNHYRMTDFQAALGLSQLGKINIVRQKREQIAERYGRTLADTVLDLPKLTPEAISSWHLYVVTIPGHGGPARRDRLLGKLRKSGIQANLHYVPVTSLAFYRARPGSFRPKGRLLAGPVASRYGDSAISLPIFPGLKPADQDRVIRELRSSL
jgi:dTDP-4-amino-4,6-dideoxygalactose transaminase